MEDQAAFAGHRPQPYRFSSGQWSERPLMEPMDYAQLSPTSARTTGDERTIKRGSVWTSAKSYLPNTKWTITMATMLLVQGVISTCLESYIFAVWQASLNAPSVAGADDSLHLVMRTGPVAARVLPAQLATVIFESIYQLILCLDAIRLRNIVQAIGISLNNLSMLIFVGIGMAAVRDASESLLAIDAIATSTWHTVYYPFIAVLTILALGTVCLGLLTWQLYGEFAWAIYRHISVGDLQLRKRYLSYEIYIALLHLDFFFLFGFWIQAITAVPHGTKTVFAIKLLALLLLPVQLILAGISARNEWKVGQGLAILLSVAEIAFTVLQLVWMYGTDIRLTQEYLPTRQRATAYAIMALPLLLATMVMAGICIANFDKGLGPVLKRSRVAADTPWDNVRVYEALANKRGESHQLVMLPPRMDLE